MTKTFFLLAALTIASASLEARADLYCKEQAGGIIFRDGLIAGSYDRTNTGDKVLVVRNRQWEKDARIDGFSPDEAEKMSSNYYLLSLDSDLKSRSLYYVQEGRGEASMGTAPEHADAEAVIDMLFLPGVEEGAYFKSLSKALLACLQKSEVEKYQVTEKAPLCEKKNGTVVAAKKDEKLEILFSTSDQSFPSIQTLRKITFCTSKENALTDLRDKPAPAQIPASLLVEDLQTSFIRYVKENPEDKWRYFNGQERLAVTSKYRGVSFLYGDDVKPALEALKQVKAVEVEKESEITGHNP